jgi:hypothetical protein
MTAVLMAITSTLNATSTRAMGGFFFFLFIMHRCQVYTSLSLDDFPPFGQKMQQASALAENRQKERKFGPA